VIALPAQTLTTLHNFDGTDGYEPSAPLVQATNGDFYGTTNAGGAYVQGGTVFKITPSGTLTTLYSFCSQGGFPSCTDGYYPEDAGLVQAPNGELYGTTEGGGVVPPDTIPGGTVFKIAPDGPLTTLYTFGSQQGVAGALPFSGLVQAANGDLYGTTVEGSAGGGAGTIFKITTSGAMTTLYTFCAQVNCADGDDPYAPLVQATNGYLYGTTTIGGAYGNGTVFKITPSGTLTTLYNFCAQSGCPDGGDSLTGLVQATNGDLYGTTYLDGANGGGTVFKITPAGTLTTLHSFCAQANCADGFYPDSALVQATDGNLYGTTSSGGTPCCGLGNRYSGTVFRITPGGTLTTLYNFCAQSGCTDGSGPTAGLVQATNGEFYGTTAAGGANGYGTIFSLSVGLGPFVETQTASGEVGAAVKILGSDLTGATSVTFNGTPATFTVVSRYLVTTTVPAGATTGKVQVATPRGTLSSNVPFRVLP
jgi:uncharacterized repeat protein (TIGR03803 family)